MRYLDLNQERKARHERIRKVSAPRSIEAIQQEYGQVCAQVGEAQFHKALIEQQIMQANQRLSQLNDEANKARAKSAKSSSQPSEKPQLATNPALAESAPEVPSETSAS